MSTAPLVLHGYWRSGTSYRVRIALNVKGLSYQQKALDLRTGAHRSEAYRTLNPQGLVPALEVGSTVLTQSTAILEWLEERWPEPPLLPATSDDRAIVRAMSLLIACDIHPLNNLRVLNRLRADFGAEDGSVNGWMGHWIAEGFAALETLIAQHGGRYSFGDRITMADCHLVPQLYAAERFQVDLTDFPTIRAVTERLRERPDVAAAHPDRQADSDTMAMNG